MKRSYVWTARRLWIQKLLHDLRGFLWGNRDFSFLEASLTSWMYPLDLDFTLKREHFYYFPKDMKGIPMRVYLSVGPQYNPTRVAAYALAHFNRYLRTKAQKNKQHFLQAADWFLQSPDGIWAYNYPWMGLSPPWISAMAQGEGLSVLIRAWVLTREAQFLNHARKAVVPFMVPVSEGGVRSTLPDGSWFLEEYPTSPPDHVLNGFLYALIGLIDLHRVDPEMASSIGLKKFLDSLERNISLWNAGFWSLYDLSHLRTKVPNLTTVSYHNLHVTQLLFLGFMTRRPRLIEVAQQWAMFARHPLNRWRAFLGKVRYRFLFPGGR